MKNVYIHVCGAFEIMVEDDEDIEDAINEALVLEVFDGIDMQVDSYEVYEVEDED